MAYSDYGGYGYRNGDRVVDRSDAVLSPAGIKSTPGMWPGWVLPLGRAGRSHHVVLGDGPVFVCLYKQSSVSVFRLSGEPAVLAEVDLLGLVDPTLVGEWEGKRYWDPTRDLGPDGLLQTVTVDGHVIDMRFERSDNYYVYGANDAA